MRMTPQEGGKQKVARVTIRASAALMILRQGISSLASQRANRLDNNNKQSAPVT